MSATATPFHPPWAVHCWADGRNVYVEIPCSQGAPYVAKYPHSEAGLSKALTLMADVYEKAKPVPPIGRHPIVTKVFGKADAVRQRKAKATFTDAQREAAAAVLRKMGVVK